MSRFPKSDHYDGRQFFNPTHPAKARFVDVVKMLTTSTRQKWPKSIANSPDLHLHESLTADQVAITFINHASVLIQTPTLTFLTDPVYSERVSPFTFVGPKRVRPPGIPFDELPPIDVVLISHNHYDHLDIETVKRLKAKFDPQFIVALGDRELLEKNGISRVEELDWWSSYQASQARVTFVPTQHFSGRGLFDRDTTLWGGYFVEVGTKKIFFGGDAAYSTHFKDIHERMGAPDLALIPIGAYDPRWFMKVVHMDPEEAVRAHMDLRSKLSIGIHFGTFQLTEEAIDQPVIDLAKARLVHGVSPDRFIVLGEGRTRIF